MFKTTTFLYFYPDEESQLKHRDYSSSSSTGHVVSKLYLDKALNEIGTRISKDKTAIPAESKIYLSKSCKLDRHKIKEIMHQASFNKTRVVEYADVVVVDKFQERLGARYLCVLDKDTVKPFRDKVNDTTKERIDAYLSITDTISIDSCSRLSAFLNLLEEIPPVETHYIFNEWGSKADVQVLENMIVCSTNTKAQFLNSTQFNELVMQRDRIVIDEEMHNSLLDMVKSTDIDDIKMAANLIDNCNLKESHYHINMLIMEEASMNKHSQISKILNSDTFKYLREINKCYFNNDFSRSGVKYSLMQIKKDNEYQTQPNMLEKVETTLKKCLLQEIRDQQHYFLSQYNYQLEGLDNIKLTSTKID
jgi:hypothetical protein